LSDKLYMRFFIEMYLINRVFIQSYTQIIFCVLSITAGTMAE